MTVVRFIILVLCTVSVSVAIPISLIFEIAVQEWRLSFKVFLWVALSWVALLGATTTAGLCIRYGRFANAGRRITEE